MHSIVSIIENKLTYLLTYLHNKHKQQAVSKKQRLEQITGKKEDFMMKRKKLQSELINDNQLRCAVMELMKSCLMNPDLWWNLLMFDNFTKT